MEEEEEPTRNRFMGAFCEENKMRRKNVSKKKKKPHEIALWGLFAKKWNALKRQRTAGPGRTSKEKVTGHSSRAHAAAAARLFVRARCKEGRFGYN